MVFVVGANRLPFFDGLSISATGIFDTGSPSLVPIDRKDLEARAIDLSGILLYSRVTIGFDDDESGRGMADWWEGLSELERKFVEAHAKNGGNVLDAARSAGYKSPHPTGHRVAKRAKVVRAMEKLRESTTNTEIATREERQSFWSKVMNSGDQSMSDRLRASELLGKSQADFVDRKELTGKDGAPLLAQVRIKFVGDDG